MSSYYLDRFGADERRRNIVENERICSNSLLNLRDCSNELNINDLWCFSDVHRLIKPLPRSVVLIVLRDVVIVMPKEK